MEENKHYDIILQLLFVISFPNKDKYTCPENCNFLKQTYQNNPKMYFRMNAHTVGKFVKEQILHILILIYKAKWQFLAHPIQVWAEKHEQEEIFRFREAIKEKELNLESLVKKENGRRFN